MAPGLRAPDAREAARPSAAFSPHGPRLLPAPSPRPPAARSSSRVYTVRRVSLNYQKKVENH